VKREALERLWISVGRRCPRVDRELGSSLRGMKLDSAPS
jgi:hypothetical protein